MSQVYAPSVSPSPSNDSSAWRAFRRFNEEGGKFRVALLNLCNLDCFFCHNEAMDNPRRRRGESGARRMRGEHRIDDASILRIINTYAAMGGHQINLTGGEPMAHPALFDLLDAIDPGSARVMLNSNVTLASRLLARPPHPVIDTILASLHTTDDATFRDKLGGKSARQVMDHIVALRDHGYNVEINYSLGPYNAEAFAGVLDFALAHRVPLKAIAFVRSSDDPAFYGGDWVNPGWLTALLERRGANVIAEKQRLGGLTTTWRAPCGTPVKVKNIARGRLRTDYCTGCPLESRCGEGIYGLRVGVDGLWKPCLLRRERFSDVDPSGDIEAQILAQIAAMIGDWERARFVGGAPA